MKAICSILNEKNQEISTAGMNNRTIIHAKNKKDLYKKASTFSKNQSVQLEIWNNEADFYKSSTTEIVVENGR